MNMIKATTAGLAASSLALLAACAGPAQMTLPDGSVAFLIDCDGSGRGLNACFERAGRSCGAAGYSIVNADGRRVSGSDVSDSEMARITKAFATDTSSILVKCDS